MTRVRARPRRFIARVGFAVGPTEACRKALGKRQFGDGPRAATPEVEHGDLIPAHA